MLPASKTRPSTSTSLTATMFETTSAVTKKPASATKRQEKLVTAQGA
jgi:hypothetical protein